jgi:hypothetical protein
VAQDQNYVLAVLDSCLRQLDELISGWGPGKLEITCLDAQDLFRQLTELAELVAVL